MVTAVVPKRGGNPLDWFPIPCLLAISLLLSASLAQANATARFRVTDVQTLKAGKQAKLTIFWEYNDGNSSYSGKGVKFYLHSKLPGYGNAQKGTKITQKVDMTNGNGLATLLVDLPPGAQPGQKLVLTGVWPGYGHQWGTDAGRAGGQFALPTSATGGLKVPVNQATAVDFAQLPGVGPALAQRMVAFRDQQKGKKIKSLGQLVGVKGISPKKLTRLQPYLTTKAPKRLPTIGQISVNLNSATQAQLQAVPGIGPARAKAIVDHRATMKKQPYAYQRKFRSNWDVTKVPGITSGLMTKLQPYIKFSGRTKAPRARRNSALRRPARRGILSPRSWFRPRRR